MVSMEHKRYYCNQCECWTVICKTCGNNSCNGGSGYLADGTRCKDCDGAYDLMMSPTLMMLLDIEDYIERSPDIFIDELYKDGAI